MLHNQVFPKNATNFRVSYFPSPNGGWPTRQTHTLVPLGLFYSKRPVQPNRISNPLFRQLWCSNIKFWINGNNLNTNITIISIWSIYKLCFCLNSFYLKMYDFIYSRNYFIYLFPANDHNGGSSLRFVFEVSEASFHDKSLTAVNDLCSNK